MNWNSNPELAGRTVKDYPNDIQVIVHEGHPRITGVTPEYIWVTITEYNNGVYSGKLLNKPSNLKTHQLNQIINFVVPANPKLPALEVSPEYLKEIKNWNVHKCEKCGNDQLLESPLVFIEKKFPNQPKDAIMESFTYFCFVCGGVMVIEKNK